MKVWELIEELEDCDQSKEVVWAGENDGDFEITEVNEERSEVCLS